MLIFKHVTIEDAMHHKLIEDFTYSLGNQEHLGIIGEEGNGKSTLLKAIYHQGIHEEYAKMSGSIETDYTHIGYFKQHITSEWQSLRVYEYLLKREIDEEIPWERYNELALYENLAIQLRMPHDLIHSEQTVHTLSGGEKVKLQLLKIMRSACDLLLLDEPTNDLDIDTLQWLEQFIKRSTIPIVFVSHDETLLQNTADVLLHMEQLNKQSKSRYTIFKGSYEAYVKSRQSSLQKERQLAHKEKQEYQKKMIKLNDFKNAVHDAQNDTVRSPFYAAALKTKMKNLKAQERRFEEQGYRHVDSVEEAIHVAFAQCFQHPGKCVLSVEHLNIQMQDKVLIQDVSFDVRGQDKIVITGANGCGKSLLMKELYQLLKTRDDICIGYMPQNYHDAFMRKQTPIDFLRTSRQVDDETQSRSLLGSMRFTAEEMLHDVYSLSEGQKAKLYILRFIKMKCDVLLLDEPTRNLSPLTNPVIRRVLQDYQGCIIAVSHDRKFISEVFTRQINIHNHHAQVTDIEPAEQ